jgi:valyl-tRNA synthetase
MKGRKMSKSLGNGIDPLAVVRAYGADAMRYTIVSQCAVGTDIALDHENVEATFANGRNFANKIWNAGRFALMSLGDAPVRALDEVEKDLELEDRWILSRLQHASALATEALERFRLHEYCEGVYHFFWGEICDWYLELVKSRLGHQEQEREGGAASREAARSTLVTVLDRALRLLHPVVPFVSAELWARLPPVGDERRAADLIVAPWPEPEARWMSQDVEARMAGFQELIVEVRRLRKEYGIPEGGRIAIHVFRSEHEGGVDGFPTLVREQTAALEQLARVNRVETEAGHGVGAHAVLKNGVEVFVPLEGVIDLDRERSRLREEIAKLEGLHAGTSRKLDNAAFVARAPAEVVQKERDRLAQLEEQRTKLGVKLAALEGVGA